MKPKVYLAGHISGHTYNGCNDWREYATQELFPRIEARSPLRGKGFLANIPGAIQNDNRYAKFSPTSTVAGITGRDRNDVRVCDAVLMHFTDTALVSAGSMIEIGWADAFRTPLVLVAHEDDPVRSHAIVRGCATYITDNLDEGIALIKLLLLEDA